MTADSGNGTLADDSERLAAADWTMHCSFVCRQQEHGGQEDHGREHGAEPSCASCGWGMRPPSGAAAEWQWHPTAGRLFGSACHVPAPPFPPWSVGRFMIRERRQLTQARAPCALGSLGGLAHDLIGRSSGGAQRRPCFGAALQDLRRGQRRALVLARAKC